MIMLISLVAAVPGTRTECLKPRWTTLPWRLWLLMKWLETRPKLMGSVMKVAGVGMNKAPMPSQADSDELVVL